MYFRFGVALAIVIAVSICGVMIENENQRLKQQITQQQFRQDLLVQQVAAARLESQQLGAPPRLIQAVEEGRIALPAPESPSQLVRTPEHELH